MNSQALVPSGVASSAPDEAAHRVTDAAVPPVFVHKRRPESVLLTTWRGSDADVVAGATWSSTHPYFRRGADGSPDLLLVAETLRQSVILIAHAAHCVPLDSAFVMKRLAVRLSRGHRWEPGGDVDVAVVVRCRDVSKRAGVLRSMLTEVSFLRGDRTVATGQGDLVVLPALTYDRVRKGALARHHTSGLPRVDASTAGCGASSDVILARVADGDWRLALDTGHPYLFDHPADHVPGMAIIEAARQAAHGSRLEAASGFEALFHRYAEFTPEVSLSVRPSGFDFQVDVEQEGESVAEIRFHGHGDF